jgi:putative flippase GtrA
MTMSRLIRFALVGVVNTINYYLVYLLLHLFLPYLVAHVIAFVLSMIGSFFLNCYFTFKQRPTWSRFLLFPLSTLTNFVITTVGLYLLVRFAGMNERIAPLVAASVAVPVTFVVTKVILVGRKPGQPMSEPGVVR